MNRKLVTFVLIALATPLIAEERQRYIIALRGDAPRVRVESVLAAIAPVEHRVRRFEKIAAFAADLTSDELAVMRRSPDVEYVEPVVERVAFEMPSTTFPVAGASSPETAQVTPWGIDAVRAASVWGVTRGATINVAVVDTGVDSEHPDLAHAYAGGYNVFDPLKTADDDHVHGTHVAGTIAAADNSFGVVGVAPDVKIWGVKVLDAEGRGTNETLIAGIEWVIKKAETEGGRWIMNMSLGASGYSQAEADACSRAIAAGVVIVAASGNRSGPAVSFPARHRGVIAVGAVDESLTRAPFSNYGVDLSLVGPGVRVLSTVIEGSSTSADVTISSEKLMAWGIKGSPFGSISEDLVACGLGYPHQFPASVRGKIALIERGEIYFRDKARNAKEAGAAAVIIHDNDPEGVPRNWTLLMACTENCDSSWDKYEFPLTLAVTRAVGERLLKAAQPAAVGYRQDRYDSFNGTSMATPHVAGVAAMLLALDPSLNVAQVAFILEQTARDLGAPGRDFETAVGMVDALAAAQYVAPSKFGLLDREPATTRRRRSGR